MNYKNPQEIEKFYKAILTLENEKECAQFFADIFTYQELESIAQRLEVATLLLEGKNYSDVNKTTGASTATISRVSRCLNYGEGGYKKVIDKIGENNV